MEQVFRRLKARRDRDSEYVTFCQSYISKDGFIVQYTGNRVQLTLQLYFPDQYVHQPGRYPGVRPEGGLQEVQGAGLAPPPGCGWAGRAPGSQGAERGGGAGQGAEEALPGTAVKQGGPEGHQVLDRKLFIPKIFREKKLANKNFNPNFFFTKKNFLQKKTYFTQKKTVITRIFFFLLKKKSLPTKFTQPIHKENQTTSSRKKSRNLLAKNHTTSALKITLPSEKKEIMQPE